MYKAVTVLLSLTLAAFMAGCASDDGIPRNTGSLYDEDRRFYDDPFYRDRYYGYPYGNRYYYYGPPPQERRQSTDEAAVEFADESTPGNTSREYRRLRRNSDEFNVPMGRPRFSTPGLP